MSIKILTIKEDIMSANEKNAEDNRKIADNNNILIINLMSSPGSGKTSTITQIINRFKDKISIAIIEGDVASTIDADKIDKQGIPVVQINTEGACRLDANMVRKGMDNLPLEDIDLIIIENVGNLICTAEFSIGEHVNVMILSVPEGDDKPYKYPLMFTESDVVLVNKIDVLPYFDFNLEAFSNAVNGLNPSAVIFPVSAKTGEGMENWFSWIEKRFAEKQE